MKMFIYYFKFKKRFYVRSLRIQFNSSNNILNKCKKLSFLNMFFIYAKYILKVNNFKSLVYFYAKKNLKTNF